MSHRVVLEKILSEYVYIKTSGNSIDRLWIDCSRMLEEMYEDALIERVDQATAYPLNNTDLKEIRDVISRCVIGKDWESINNKINPSLQDKEIRKEFCVKLMKMYGIVAVSHKLSTHRLLQIHELGDSLSSKARVYKRCMMNAQKIGNANAFQYFESKHQKHLRISRICEKRLKIYS